jgi:hypothetical protein
MIKMVYSYKNKVCFYELILTLMTKNGKGHPSNEFFFEKKTSGNDFRHCHPPLNPLPGGDFAVVWMDLTDILV